MTAFTPDEKKLLDAALRYVIETTAGEMRKTLEQLRKKVGAAGDWYAWQDVTSDDQLQGKRVLVWSPDAHPKVFIARWSKGKWRTDDGRIFDAVKIMPLPDAPTG